MPQLIKRFSRASSQHSPECTEAAQSGTTSMGSGPGTSSIAQNGKSTTMKSKLSPKDTQRKEKQPWTLKYLTDTCKKPNKDNLKDATILACLTTAFWGTVRLGEVTITKLDGFNPDIHVKVSDVQHRVKDRNNLKETIIFIPWMKAMREQGEKIFWVKQNGVVDPQNTLTNHIKINNPPEGNHLFTFKHNNGM